MEAFKRINKYTAIVLLIGGMALPWKNLEAQSGTQTYQCNGNISGLQSSAVLQVESGGYSGGPYVTGQIQNQATAYTFTGELFGGTEGFVSLVEINTGQRIDRVWIGLNQMGFTLVPEDGSRYVFSCQR
jgi:hypothetical protein